MEILGSIIYVGLDIFIPYYFNDPSSLFVSREADETPKESKEV